MRVDQTLSEDIRRYGLIQLSIQRTSHASLCPMLRPLQNVFLMLLILTSTASAYGQTIDLAMRRQIDQVIQRCLQADGTPSASIAIVMDDHLAYANAFGEAVLTGGLNRDSVSACLNLQNFHRAGGFAAGGRWQTFAQ